MPVFLSHSTPDDSLARSVYDRLTTIHGIKCYIDDLDKQAGVARGTPAITTLILSRLESCTHLLAVVTQNTARSWWVPFEVGVARRAPRVISTYTNTGMQSLPEFLKEWPVLTGANAVDEFAKLYKSQQVFLLRELKEGTAARPSAVASVDSFHRQLKTALGQ
jgi:hypothetical protein